MYWVGHTDLEVAFCLTALDSGQPIAGARIEVRSEGGSYEERGEQQFVLSTDANGVARKECRHNTCSGARSALGFTDSFAVHLPWWQFRVSAPGFESSAWMDLAIGDIRRRTHRIGPGRARVVVPVTLRRRPADPDAAANQAGRAALRDVLSSQPTRRVSSVVQRHSGVIPWEWQC
jgi:hypothetical protein